MYICITGTVTPARSLAQKAAEGGSNHSGYVSRIFPRALAMSLYSIVALRAPLVLPLFSRDARESVFLELRHHTVVGIASVPTQRVGCYRR